MGLKFSAYGSLYGQMAHLKSGVAERQLFEMMICTYRSQMRDLMLALGVSLFFTLHR